MSSFNWKTNFSFDSVLKVGVYFPHFKIVDNKFNISQGIPLVNCDIKEKSNGLLIYVKIVTDGGLIWRQKKSVI